MSAEERLLYRPGEAAEAIGISRAKAYELIAAGAIPSIRVGSSIRIPVAELRGWVERQLAERRGDEPKTNLVAYAEHVERQRDEARRLLSASLTLQTQSEDEADALRAERDALRAALAGHAIQCPQCQDVASRAALTTSPEEKATP